MPAVCKVRLLKHPQTGARMTSKKMTTLLTEKAVRAKMFVAEQLTGFRMMRSACARGVMIAVTCAVAPVSLCVTSLAEAGDAAPLKWTTPALAAKLPHAAGSVSCSSARLCLLTGQDDEYLVYTGKKWSDPQKIAGAPEGVSSLDCVVGVGLCTAVVDHGVRGGSEPGDSYVQFSGNSWSNPITPESNSEKINSLSCATKTFCVALFESSTPSQRETSYAVNKAGSWSPATPFYENYAGLLDCVSASFCEASDLNALGLLTFDGTSWKIVTEPKFTGFPWALSCPTSSFCVLGQGVPYAATGSVLVYNGTKWTGPDLANYKPAGLIAVSCASASFCVVASSGVLGPSSPSKAKPMKSSGSIYYYDGGKWSPPTALDSDGIRSISCPSRSFCVAVDGTGRVLIGR